MFAFSNEAGMRPRHVSVPWHESGLVLSEKPGGHCSVRRRGNTACGFAGLLHSLLWCDGDCACVGSVAGQREGAVLLFMHATSRGHCSRQQTNRFKGTVCEIPWNSHHFSSWHPPAVFPATRHIWRLVGLGLSVLGRRRNVAVLRGVPHRGCPVLCEYEHFDS